MRAPPYSTRPDELFTREVIDDPHPLFARLRAERPVSRVGDTGVHLVATWDLVEEALQREEDFSAHLTGVLVRGEDGTPAVFELPVTGANQVIATADEPDHAVHRGLAQPRLAASRTAALEAPVRAWAKQAVTPWVAAGGGDFVPLAELVPARVVAALLGLPDGDVSRHRQWAMMGGDMLAGAVTSARVGAMAQETARMVEYLHGQLAEARLALRHDADAPLLHALGRGVETGAVDVEHAIGIAIVMFGAGGESTAALIGNAVRRLAADAALADRLRAERALVPRFVEEVARLDAPFKFHYRAVKRDCKLGGMELLEGDRLMLLWASANRDAGHTEHPDALRLDRRHPKDHLSFGRGSHFCIGAPVARLEARIVCEEVLDQTSALALVPDDPPVLAQSIFVQRHERLPVAATS